MQSTATTVEKNWRLLKNVKIYLPYDPAIPLLVLYLKELKE
jgi:hypothetical protein